MDDKTFLTRAERFQLSEIVLDFFKDKSEGILMSEMTMLFIDYASAHLFSSGVPQEEIGPLLEKLTAQIVKDVLEGVETLKAKFPPDEQ